MIINGKHIEMYNKHWNHAEDRVRAIKAKHGNDYFAFKKEMTTRLKRIKREDKLYYTAGVLIHLGYPDIAELYDSKLVMNKLTN